jgi:hypothetical protein
VDRSQNSIDVDGRSELHRLEERMRTDLQIDDLVLESSREGVLALAERLGWRVRALEPWGSGWLRCRLERPSTPRSSATHPLLA